MENYGDVIDDDVARILQVLILVAKPQRVLEIGTSIGFSTVMMARMLKRHEGKIVTIELDEKAAGQARANFKRQGIDAQIEIIVGNAREVVASMDQKFDLIFDQSISVGIFCEDGNASKALSEMVDRNLIIGMISPKSYIIKEKTEGGSSIIRKFNFEDEIVLTEESSEKELAEIMRS
mgnify:CR=1 FL=1